MLAAALAGGTRLRRVRRRNRPFLPLHQGREAAAAARIRRVSRAARFSGGTVLQSPETHAREVLDQWLDAVNRGDADTLVAMYDESARLIPTFSPRILSTPGELRDYFVALASRPGLEVRLHERMVAAQALAARISVISGLYSFSFDIDGNQLTFPSRFSMAIDAERQGPIVHHHSSQVPRTLS